MIKETKTRIKIACAIVLAFAIIGSYTMVPAMASNFNPTPPSSLLVGPSKSYYYVTHQPHGSRDIDIDSTTAQRWPDGTTSVSYYTDMVNPTPNLTSGYGVETARSKIVSEAASWYNALSSSSTIPSLNHLGQLDVGASLGPCGNGMPDQKNVVTFCSTTAFDFAATYTSPSYTSGQVTSDIAEKDIVFNNDRTWGDGVNSDLNYYTTHEFGHFYGLGDLYKIYGTACDSDFPAGSTPDANVIMCGVWSDPQLGDKDGMRYLYPKTFSASVTLQSGGKISGSDSAIAPTSVDTYDSRLDLIHVYADLNSNTDTTLLKAKAFWNIDSATGSGTAGSTTTLKTITGGSVYDVGATLYKVDGDSYYDLIVTYSFDTGTAKSVYYTIYWDINKSSSTSTLVKCNGGASSCSNSTSTTPVEVPFSTGDEGTDVMMFDVNGSGAKEIVVVDAYDDGSGDWPIYYYYGTLSSSGSVSGWTMGSTSGTYIDPKQEIGTQVVEEAKRILAFNFRAQDSSYIEQHIVHMATSNALDAVIQNKHAPLDYQGLVLDGVGGGDAVNIGQDANKVDLVYSWGDAGSVYYTIDWDSRINSHP
jgi:hypothetical protein